MDVYASAFAKLGIAQEQFDRILANGPEVRAKILSRLQDDFITKPDARDVACVLIQYVLKEPHMDDEDWITINGTHVLIDENGNAKSGGKLTGMNFSEAKSQKSAKLSKAPSAAWKAKNDAARQAHHEMKDSDKALTLCDLYGIRGDHESPMYEKILKAFKAKDGSLDKLVDEYYDIMEKNGDPTPTKETSGQIEITDEERDKYGGWDESKLAKLGEVTGLEGEELKHAREEISGYMRAECIDWSGNQDLADTLDTVVDRSPAYDGTMYRGMKFETGDGSFDDFMDTVKVGGTLRMRGPSSWTSDEEMAYYFSGRDRTEIDNVIIRCIKNRTSAPIAYQSWIKEDEVLASSKAAWTVLDVYTYERSYGRRCAIITVVEKGE